MNIDVNNDFFDLDEADKFIVSEFFESSDFTGWKRVSPWMASKLIDKDIQVKSIDENGLYINLGELGSRKASLFAELEREILSDPENFIPLLLSVETPYSVREIVQIYTDDDFYSEAAPGVVVKDLIEMTADPTIVLSGMADDVFPENMQSATVLLEKFKREFRNLVLRNRFPGFGIKRALSKYEKSDELTVNIRMRSGRTVNINHAGYQGVIGNTEKVYLLKDVSGDKLSANFIAAFIILTGYQDRSGNLEMGIRSPVNGLNALIADKILLSTEFAGLTEILLGRIKQDLTASNYIKKALTGAYTPFAGARLRNLTESK